MARSVNKVTLIGTLGRDPEVRSLTNGNTVANISLATDESYNDRTTGQRTERTEWHRIVAYGKLAEIIQQYLRKGSRAYFEGRLQTREWEKDGIKRYSTEIVANEMMMLDRASDNTNMQQAQPMDTMYQSAPQAGGYATSGYQAVPQPQPAYAPPMQQQQAPQAMPQYQPQAAPQHQPVAPQQQPQPMQPAPIAQPQNNFDAGFDDDIPF